MAHKKKPMQKARDKMPEKKDDKSKSKMKLKGDCKY